MSNNRQFRDVRRLLIIQSLLILLVSASVLVVWNSHQAISVFLGGIVAFLPTLLFVKKLFAYEGARAAKQIAQGFYAGQALKIASSVCLFAVVFYFYAVSALAFFLAYIGVVMSHWLSPWIVKHKQAA